MTNAQIPHKGGRPTPARAGLHLKYRDTIWQRLAAQEEGSIFRPDTILADLPADAIDDFHQALGYDHLHVGRGWHTAMLETQHNRMPPDPERVVDAWCTVHGWGGASIYGDWEAWRGKLFPWEPLAGYRFRVAHPGVDEVLAVGNMRLRVRSGPWWLLQDDPVGRLVRVWTDTPLKTLKPHLRHWLNMGDRTGTLEKSLAQLDAVDGAWEQDASPSKGERPSVVVRAIREMLA